MSSQSTARNISLGKTHGPRRHFASDNYAGITPEAWAALAEANQDHEPAYGNDRWTQAATDQIRDLFETPCEVFFVFNGTAANSLALSACCQSYHSVLCHEVAHVEKDECGAPEFFSNGSKLLLLPGDGGKLTPAGIEEAVLRRSDIHYPKPKVVTVTEPTEVGTLYTPQELRAIGAMTKKHGLRFHMAPPLITKAGSDGRVKKLVIGGWLWKGLGVLARFKSLRGGPLDLFGYTEERRSERALIDSYRASIEEVIAALNATNHAAAIELARIPEQIKGYGHVKERHLLAARRNWTSLSQAFRNAS
jgi:hypothetical protein